MSLFFQIHSDSLSLYFLAGKLSLEFKKMEAEILKSVYLFSLRQEENFQTKILKD